MELLNTISNRVVIVWVLLSLTRMRGANLESISPFQIQHVQSESAVVYRRKPMPVAVLRVNGSCVNEFPPSLECDCNHIFDQDVVAGEGEVIVAGLRPNFHYNLQWMQNDPPKANLTFRTKEHIHLVPEDVSLQAENRSVQVTVRMTCATFGTFKLEFSKKNRRGILGTIESKRIIRQGIVNITLTQDIDPNQSYDICVKALSLNHDNCVSDCSAQVCLPIQIPQVVPFGKPKIELQRDTSANDILLNLQPPSDYTIMDITHFNLSVEVNCAFPDPRCPHLACQRHCEEKTITYGGTWYQTYHLNNLMPWRNYTLKLRAVNEVGTGVESDHFRFRTQPNLSGRKANFSLSSGLDYVQVAIQAPCPTPGPTKFDISIREAQGHWSTSWKIIFFHSILYEPSVRNANLTHIFGQLPTARSLTVCVNMVTAVSPCWAGCSGDAHCVPLQPRCDDLVEPELTLEQIPWEWESDFNPFSTVRVKLVANTFNGEYSGITNYILHCSTHVPWGTAASGQVYWDRDSYIDSRPIYDPDQSFKLAITALGCQNNATTEYHPFKSLPIPAFQASLKGSVIVISEDLKVIDFLKNTTYTMSDSNKSWQLSEVFDDWRTNSQCTKAENNQVNCPLPEPLDVQERIWPMTLIRSNHDFQKMVYTFKADIANPEAPQSGYFDNPRTYMAIGGVLIIAALTWLAVRCRKDILKSFRRQTDKLINHGAMIISPVQKEPSRPLVVSNLVEDNFYPYSLESEFEELNRADAQFHGHLSCAMGRYWSTQTKSLNRYRNILPYDQTRVTLKNPVGGCDYINASWVKDPNSDQTFIACQGPMAHTTEHFWQMVLDFQVPLIVMLTNTSEGKSGPKVSKCHRYWPDDVNVSERQGSIEVTLTSVKKVRRDLILRTFKVQGANPSSPITVAQLHAMSWLDHGAPKSPDVLLDINENMKCLWVDQSQPSVVHCSAGVGRTGTLIAFHQIARQIQNRAQSVDILNCVYHIRGARTQMVQQMVQYWYIYSCVAKYASLNHEGDYEYYDLEGTDDEENVYYA